MKPTWSNRRQSTVIRTRELDMTLFGALRSRTRFNQGNEWIHSVTYIPNLASGPQSSADHSGPTGAHCRGRAPPAQKPETPRWLQLAVRSVAPLPRKVHRATSLVALEWSSLMSIIGR